MERLFQITWVAQCNHMGSVITRGRQEGQTQRRRWDDRSRVSERSEDAMLSVLKMEEGATNQGTQEKLEKAKKLILP